MTRSRHFKALEQEQAMQEGGERFERSLKRKVPQESLQL